MRVPERHEHLECFVRKRRVFFRALVVWADDFVNGFGLLAAILAVLVLIGIPIAGTMWALLAVVVCGRVISGQLQLVFSAGWSVAWSVSVFASAHRQW